MNWTAKNLKTLEQNLTDTYKSLCRYMQNPVLEHLKKKQQGIKQLLKQL